MAYSSPIAWTTVMNAIYTWVTNATGITAIWKSPDAPQPAFPYIKMEISSGPSPIGRDPIIETTDLTRASDIKLTPIAQNSTTYTVTLNDNDYQYVSDADATLAEICTGLCAAITETDITCVDNATYIDISEDNSSTFTIEVSDDYDDSQMSWSNNDTGHEIQTEAAGQRQAVLNIDVYSSSFSPSSNAQNYANILSSSQFLPQVIEQLSVAGVALVRSDSIDLDFAAGADNISRVQLTFVIGLSSSIVDTIGYIKTVQITNSDFGWTDEEFGDL